MRWMLMLVALSMIGLSIWELEADRAIQSSPRSRWRATGSGARLAERTLPARKRWRPGLAGRLDRAAAWGNDHAGLAAGAHITGGQPPHCRTLAARS